MFRKKTIAYLFFSVVFILSGCVGIPEGVKPVENFQLERYLGTWHEIARLDHSFERGLSKVTADYSLREDGGINVVNRGFSAEKSAWQEAQGKAYFVNDADEGHLKVSFFGPFYGSYIVFELDTVGYQYAFISGPDKDYLWLLARTPTVKPEVIDQFISMSKSIGFDTSALIFVHQ
ncbi:MULTISPECIES: lipocalin family protein [Cycloclasticus]|uniref:Outer membrane lipoprotein Blc n=1 Tax=Cycloclasticus pugetii TaxID=34068 RepID=A0AB33Z4U3_9GAMM|nr:MULTISPECIES: lipocalin family protein [Cycloclasticus]AFT66702.1 Lipocalin-like protein [Cycloclasticus sp. P1]ATI03663.1 lipocalin [Cycloclasticus sp. PY97N]EPD14154.1 Lipocalin-like protein [Cycloclasticus pugetii]